ncbi:MAG: hypothetical protein ACYCZY_09110 [Lacisediminihabitans sp.]
MMRCSSSPHPSMRAARLVGALQSATAGVIAATLGPLAVRLPETALRAAEDQLLTAAPVEPFDRLRQTASTLRDQLDAERIEERERDLRAQRYLRIRGPVRRARGAGPRMRNTRL